MGVRRYSQIKYSEKGREFNMSKKILLVDDEPKLVEMVKMGLEAQDYDVITASTGEEGLKKVRSENPDLILLDVMMPLTDGYTFMREIKDSEEFKSIPIIIQTAKAELKDLFEIEGISDYIVKPYKAEEILEMVKKYL